MRYMVASPDLSGNELRYVADCISSTWISSMGEYVERFEQAVAETTHARHAISTCNGTAALHLALCALGVGPGDEVIVPSLTYVATANAVQYCGAEPVFADVDPQTWCLSPESVERLIGSRTRGIIPVHLYGQPCDLQRLTRIADEHRLWLVEDAAEAIGASYDGRPIGSFGAASIFSFYGNKIVTTGEGGMVVTSDDRLADLLRLIRGQGMDPQRRYWHPVLGYNYRMTNIAAAIGAAQMERLPAFLAQRERIAAWYAARLGGRPRLALQRPSPLAAGVCWLFSALLDSPSQRDLVADGLAERGIETRPFFYPLHQFPTYRDSRTDAGCPVACELSGRGLNLPTSTQLSEEDVAIISQAIVELARSSSRAAGKAA